MREILFKGKRKDNGEWVEGDLFHNDNTNYPMTLIGGLILSRNKYTDEIDIDGYGLIEVDPKTVCQYTGLKDKNGKKIWENDIVKISIIHYSTRKEIVSATAKVEFVDGRFGVVWENRKEFSGFDGFVERLTEIEVIGNIFDNPELLEVTE